MSTQDTQQENTSTQDMHTEITSTTRKKRPYTRKKSSQGQDTSGINTFSTTDVAPADYAAEKQVRATDESRGEDRKLRSDLSSLYALVGMGLASVKPLAGQVIIEQAPNRAKELIIASHHSPRLRRMLKRVTRAGAYTPLLLGHGAMLLAVLVAADRIPLSNRSAALLHATGYDTVIQAKIEEYQAKNAANTHQSEQQHATA